MLRHWNLPTANRKEQTALNKRLNCIPRTLLTDNLREYEGQ